MADNAFRYVPAHNAPWLPQCSGQHATRHATPRPCRNIHAISYASVTCNVQSRYRRHCAASRAGDAAFHCGCRASAGDRWRVHAGWSSCPDLRRAHNVTCYARRHSVHDRVADKVSNTGVHVHKYLLTGVRAHPATYLAQYLNGYLTSHCAHRQTKYRIRSIRPPNGTNVVAQPRNGMDHHAASNGTSGTGCDTDAGGATHGRANTAHRALQRRGPDLRPGDINRGDANRVRHPSIGSTQCALPYKRVHSHRHPVRCSGAYAGAHRWNRLNADGGRYAGARDV
jgi:hypothetical protein